MGNSEDAEFGKTFLGSIPKHQDGYENNEIIEAKGTSLLLILKHFSKYKALGSDRRKSFGNNLTNGAILRGV